MPPYLGDWGRDLPYPPLARARSSIKSKVCMPAAGAGYIDASFCGFFSHRTTTMRGVIDDRAPFASLKTNRPAAAVVVRLYSGWSYVSIRLDAEVVEYEESGAFFFLFRFMSCHDRLLVVGFIVGGGSDCRFIRH